jgi:hypothetical protein
MADKELINATKRVFSAFIESAFGESKNKSQSEGTSEPRYSNRLGSYYVLSIILAHTPFLEQNRLNLFQITKLPHQIKIKYYIIQ